MIYSNERKLCLSGWLKRNSEQEYNTPLKLQKFLLYYESFAKVAGEKPDFDHLKGYQRGPVFSNVWGDYTKERKLFDHTAIQSYDSKKNRVNQERALKCAFIVKSLSERELSELTHKMNLWKAKEQRILSGEYQVCLDENDFNQEDAKLIQLLGEMYPIDMVKNSVVYNLDNHFFILKRKDASKLTEEHFDILLDIAENEDLFNPVYVDIDQEGMLLIE